MGKPQIFSKVAPLGQALGLLAALGQVVASNLVVVSEIDAPVGKCGVGPDQHSTADLVGRLDEFGPTNLIVSTWS